jgi:type IV secretion system protein VirB6
MAGYTVFQTLEQRLTEPLNQFISTGAQGVASYVSGPLTTALTLYVIIYGFLIIRGTINDPLTEFAFRTIKLGVIVMLVRTAGDYQTYVVDLFFHSIPNEIGSALNSGATTSASAFDALLDQGQAVAHAILKKASSWSISEAFFSALAWLLVIISSFLVASIGFIVSLYAKVALALVLALGPAFIALALFNATRLFTEAWIGQLVNYVVLQILVVATGTLLITTIGEVYRMGNGYVDFLMTAMSVGAVSTSAAIIFYQLPSIASALAAGGASLSYGYSASRDLKNGTPYRAGAAAASAGKRAASATWTKLRGQTS